MNDASPPRAGSSRTVLVAILSAVLLAAMAGTLALAQVRGWEGATNADGVSYLDLAARYREGDWRAIGNGYWSPLYPMLLGAAQRLAALLPGAPRAELAVVFGTNGVIFALAALAFARLAYLLLTPVPATASRRVLAARIVTAGTVALWSLVRFIGATTITPDALLAALLYLVAAELVSAWRDAPSAGRDLRMGALLAAGYWTKAVFFPVAAVAMGAYVLLAGRAMRSRGTSRGRPLTLPRVLLTALLLSLPLTAAQSWSQGRPSFGETGRLNYRWYVGGSPRGAPVSEPVEATRDRHAPAAIAMERVPGAVLFAGSVPGAFPYWYDPSRFEPGGMGPVSVAAQWRAVQANLPWYGATGGLLFALALVALAGAAGGGGAVRAGRLWCTVPALATLALYTLTHVEGRMGAASLAIVLLAMLTLVDVAPRTGRRAAVALECVGLALLTVFAAGRISNRVPPTRTTALADAGALPAAMRQAGLRPGDAVGVVGDPYGLRWAHETDARIVVVIPPTAVTEAMLDSAARESAARGYRLAAIVIPPSNHAPVTGAVALPGEWRMLRTREW
jgi:hypothetical protein